MISHGEAFLSFSPRILTFYLLSDNCLCDIVGSKLQDAAAGIDAHYDLNRSREL